MTTMVGTWISNILFPCFCFHCGAEGSWWCQRCRGDEIVRAPLSLCPGCAQATGEGVTCPRCAPERSLNGLTSLGWYQPAGLLGRLIRGGKYSYAGEVYEVLGELICRVQERYSTTPQVWSLVEDSPVVIPVPLHPRRLRARGFNQAVLLARWCAKLWQFSVEENALVRRRFTRPQVGLTRAERLQNLSQAFAWIVEGSAPRRVILIDDVFTTGTTLEECARVLKAHGSEQVWGWTVARD